MGNQEDHTLHEKVRDTLVFPGLLSKAEHRYHMDNTNMFENNAKATSNFSTEF